MGFHVWKVRGSGRSSASIHVQPKNSVEPSGKEADKILTRVEIAATDQACDEAAAAAAAETEYFNQYFKEWRLQTMPMAADKMQALTRGMLTRMRCIREKRTVAAITMQVFTHRMLTRLRCMREKRVLAAAIKIQVFCRMRLLAPQVVIQLLKHKELEKVQRRFQQSQESKLRGLLAILKLRSNVKLLLDKPRLNIVAKRHKDLPKATGNRYSNVVKLRVISKKAFIDLDAQRNDAIYMTSGNRVHSIIVKLLLNIPRVDFAVQRSDNIQKLLLTQQRVSSAKKVKESINTVSNKVNSNVVNTPTSNNKNDVPIPAANVKITTDNKPIPLRYRDLAKAAANSAIRCFSENTAASVAAKMKEEFKLANLLEWNELILETLLKKSRTRPSNFNLAHLARMKLSDRYFILACKHGRKDIVRKLLNVCVHVYIRVCVYVVMHVCIYTCVFASIRVCKYVHILLC